MLMNVLKAFVSESFLKKIYGIRKKKSINDLTINVKCTHQQYPLKYTYIPNSRITYGRNLTLLYVSSTFLI